MDIDECLRYLADQKSAVIRFYDEDGVKTVRVAIDNEKENRVVISIRPVTSTVADAVVETVNAAAQENVVQVRRSALRVV